MEGLLSFRKHQDNQGKKYNSVPEVALLQPSKPAVLCCAVHNDVGDMSANLSGQQLLGGLGQMLAFAMWMCEVFWGRMSRMHTQE